MKLINADLLKEKAQDMRFRSAGDICKIIDQMPDESAKFATNLQADCKVATDLIHRQDAIDAVKELCKHYTPTKSTFHPHVDFVVELLEQLPSVQPEQGWIPIKMHPATDEEKENRPDIDYWFDCPMPDDYQEILVTVRHKNYSSVEKDVCYVDDSYGLDSGYDWWTEVIAWMPLPEPYREEGDECEVKKTN